MRKTDTIESQVAKTILEEPISVKVGRKTYQAASPSIATLILVSEAVSRIPEAPMDGDKIVESSLAIAKDCEPVAEIAAILILGAKAIKAEERKPFSRWRRGRSRKYKLTQELMTDHSPAEMFMIISKLLSKMEVADFFALTTFLQGVNLLRPTKVVNE